MLKSTQTNKYSTACYVQESPVSSELKPGTAKIKTSATGTLYCVFPAVLMTFNCYNRMARRYDERNLSEVIRTCPRINELKKHNKWRGELNHPNPDIKGQVYSDIRMTIPEPMRTSHFISEDYFADNKYHATITTHPKSDCGQLVTSEIIDLQAVPSFSVRLLGHMIPNALPNQPNMKVNKVITFDWVDFQSHEGAVGDISNIKMESVVFLKELAQYCVEQSDAMSVVCESFQFSVDELTGISKDGSLVVDTNDNARVHIPLANDVRREAMSILTNRGLR